MGNQSTAVICVLVNPETVKNSSAPAGGHVLIVDSVLPAGVSLPHWWKQLPKNGSSLEKIIWENTRILLFFWIGQKKKYIYTHIHLFKRQSNRNWERSSISGLLSKCSQQPGLTQAEGSSQELHQSYPHGWQEFKYLSHHLRPRHISRELDYTSFILVILGLWIRVPYSLTCLSGWPSAEQTHVVKLYPDLQSSQWRAEQ